MVRDRRMPQPKRVNSRNVWDRRRLDDALRRAARQCRPKSLGQRSLVGGTAMPRFKLPYLTFDGDRHGTVRLYVRVPGQPKIRIRERPGSPEFMDAYHRAVAEGAAARRSSPEAAKAGSFRHLCVRYYASAAFTRLDEGTQAWRRHHLDLLARDHGDKPVAVLQPKHVRKLRDELRDSPIVANVRLKALRALFSWAVEEEEAPHDPTLVVKALRHVSKGFHSCSALYTKYHMTLLGPPLSRD
jgi:integrase/recombinase XerD